MPATTDRDAADGLAVLELLLSDGGRLLTLDEARAELGRAEYERPHVGREPTRETAG